MKNLMDHMLVAREVISTELEALEKLRLQLDYQFSEAVDAILCSKGRVIVCGMGKSGIIGKKITATLSSTGTPSFFIHPGEAYHGDLGMVKPEDVFVVISNSGETAEVVKLLPFIRNNGNELIALTGNPKSTLAKASKLHLDVSVDREACPLNLAPTSSTTVTLVMGDALAVALMQARSFEPENFAKFHPGGELGRRLMAVVDTEMISELPYVQPSDKFLTVVSAVSHSKLGLTLVGEIEETALITDGDLRRAIEKHGHDSFELQAKEIMTTSPLTVAKGTRVEDALILMSQKNITSLMVEDDGKIIGVFKK